VVYLDLYEAVRGRECWVRSCLLQFGLDDVWVYVIVNLGVGKR
jgi:hypothetical protein